MTNALMTVPEVAELLRVSESTIHRRVAEGALPHLRFGRSLRFNAQEVLAAGASEAAESARTRRTVAAGDWRSRMRAVGRAA